MKKERKVWAITLIAFWWLAPNQTNARQIQDTVRTLKEVVITATKFSKSQLETAKVLTVIDEAQIQRSSGKDLSQLLNEQVGLVINGANSSPGKDKSVFLRGAGGQYTLILLDGIPVSDPSGVGGAFDLRLLPLIQVERIEILKGSQSTLYGSDAIAGVINIITKKKSDKRIGGFGTLSFGSYNTINGNAGVSGSSEIIDYNFNYTRFQTDGVSEAKDETGNGNFDKDGCDQNSIQLGVNIKPHDKLSVRPFARFTDFDGMYDAGAFADDSTAVFTTKLFNYGLTADYTLSNGAIHWQYSHSTTDRSYERSFEKSLYKGNFDNAEVFVNHDLGNNFQVLAGVNYQKLKMEDESLPEKVPAIHITSPYASFFVKSLLGFSAEVGGRFNSHSEFGNVFTYSINPSYLINNSVKLFANYSTGFKAPTLNELYGPFGANGRLLPQESGSMEIGTQYFGRDNKFDIRITYFERKIKNAIVYGASGYVNLDEQNDQGLEVEPTMRVNDKLSIRGFYAFVDGEVITKTVANTDTTFNNLIRRPKHSFGLNIGYQVTNNFFASVNLKTFGDRRDSYFNPVDFSTSSVRLAAYQLLDVYVEYKFAGGRIKLFSDVKNILDQDYAEVYGYTSLKFNINTGFSFRI